MTSQFPRDGGCRCGKVRFRVTAPPLITMACHCRGCQRMTGSPFSLSALFPAAGFERLAGETVVGGMHAIPQHQFCAWCMSWVFTHPSIPGFINIRSTMLDDPEGFEPFIETVTTEKLSWVDLKVERSFEQFPPPETFPELIAAYAGRAG